MRARIDLARYRCFLLGLPEELLPDTPQSIVDILLTRHATLRKGFDDTCSALVRATMTADLTSDRSLSGRLHTWLERAFAKLFFVKNVVRGGKPAAARVGIQIGLADRIGAAAAGILIAARMTPYAIAARIPSNSRRGRPLAGPQINQATGSVWARPNSRQMPRPYRPAHA